MPTVKPYLELIARGPVSGVALESTGAVTVRDTTNARRELLERLSAEIAYIEAKAKVDIDQEAVQELLDEAGGGLDRIFGEGPDTELGDAHVSGLEAVVRTDGSRPVLFVEDDFVDVLAPSIGDYAAVLSRMKESVRQVCQSVGRVDDPSVSLGYQGTAWMVAEGLVATNFHVLEAIAPGGVRRDGRFEGRLNTGVAVHFGHEVSRLGTERRFPIRRVVSVGLAGAAQHAQPSGLNFDGLDLAILELEPVPGRPFPPPLTVARGDDPRTRGGLASAGREIYLVGYPGNAQSTTPDLFATIFAGVKSFKRLAPGEIMTAPGEVPDDPRGWILAHDASTLGGNSGSAVVDLASDGRTALGLHFAGRHARQNWAHALERVTTELSQVLPPIGG